ncbi:N-acetylneuraminate synthase [Glycocaulis abyssi]|uniref:N-acetylneuraminate synthase n=1 Tax=Glycocaulis abyssi TaxID=1433403 RepID=A0ABV9NCZ7_9PROT
MTSSSVRREDGVLFIAEAGVNHNGDAQTAIALCDVARQAGADAVKFQTFNAAMLATAGAEKASYQDRNAPAEGESQRDMLKKLELTVAEFRAVRDHCAKIGIEFISTPFDEDSADFLNALGVDRFKVSSGDLTHLDFLQHLARFGKPIIISTGMATLAEVEDAVRAIEEAGNPPLSILHCVSNYPARPDQANLRAMNTLAAAFGRPVGWSDHTEGGVITLASVAAGARIIEKHFTLDRTMPGPDHAASLEPNELTELIAGVRAVEAALGDGIKRPTVEEQDTARVARRSLVAARDVGAGTRLGPDDVAARRPGSGLAPKRKSEVLGRKAARDIKEGELLSWEMLAP